MEGGRISYRVEGSAHTATLSFGANEIIGNGAEIRRCHRRLNILFAAANAFVGCPESASAPAPASYCRLSSMILAPVFTNRQSERVGSGNGHRSPRRQNS